MSDIVVFGIFAAIMAVGTSSALAQTHGTCRLDKDCDDGNACTNDSCGYDPDVRLKICQNDPIPGCCTQDSECNDGNDCTNDSCQNAQCRHDKKPGCVPSNCKSDPECDDGNACTQDQCISIPVSLCDSKRGCSNKPISGCCTKDSDCDDGNSLTADHCAIPPSSNGAGTCEHGPICPPAPGAPQAPQAAAPTPSPAPAAQPTTPSQQCTCPEVVPCPPPPPPPPPPPSTALTSLACTTWSQEDRKSRCCTDHDQNANGKIDGCEWAKLFGDKTCFNMREKVECNVSPYVSNAAIGTDNLNLCCQYLINKGSNADPQMVGCLCNGGSIVPCTHEAILEGTCTPSCVTNADLPKCDPFAPPPAPTSPAVQ